MKHILSSETQKKSDKSVGIKTIYWISIELHSFISIRSSFKFSFLSKNQIDQSYNRFYDNFITEDVDILFIFMVYTVKTSIIVD